MTDLGTRSVTVDPKNVREFVAMICGAATRAFEGTQNPGLLQVTSLHPLVNGIKIVGRFEIGAVDEIIKAANAEAEAGFNVYIEGRTISSDTPRGKRGGEENTMGVFAIVIDSDADKGAVGQIPLEPSMTVETSPGNCHHWYFFDKAVTQQKGKELGGRLRAVSGGDSDTGNPTQPYRVAGTPNYVNAGKRERGRVDAPTTILSHGKSYSIAQLDEALAAAGEMSRPMSACSKVAEGVRHYDAAELLTRLGPFNRQFREAELRQTSHPDRSRGFHSLVGKLKSDGYSVSEIHALIEAYPESCWNEKYRDRLLPEIERSSRKFDEEPAPPGPGHNQCPLPTIHISGGGLANEADQAEKALISAEAPFFQRAGELVSPYEVEIASFHGTRTKTALLGPVNETMIVDKLCRVARFEKYCSRKRKFVPINPTLSVARTILSRRNDWGFRSIAGVTSTPILRPNGSLFAIEGYDEQTRMLVMALPDLPEIPDEPSRADAINALQSLLELLAEFPFVDDASRAVALSALLTVVCRGAMPAAPMHVTTAPAPGTGKSYLFDLASLIATGQKCPVTAFSRSDDENEKRIDGSLLESAPIICIDNVNGELRSDKLCQAIERPVVEVRPLGASDKKRIENKATFFATGNNIAVRGDLTRRVVISSLDATMERPELRQFHRRPDQAIIANRGAYIASCLIIVRAYIVAGRPGVLPALASFEDWSNSVRSALVWLGTADPVSTMQTAREEDHELLERKAVFDALFDVFGVRAVTVREMISATEEQAEDSSPDNSGFTSTKRLRYPDLIEALNNVANDRRNSIDAETLGKWLRSNKGRIVGDRQLCSFTTSRGAKWAIKPAGTVSAHSEGG